MDPKLGPADIINFVIKLSPDLLHNLINPLRIRGNFSIPDSNYQIRNEKFLILNAISLILQNIVMFKLSKVYAFSYLLMI